jgi:anti-anti-sigma regulatory factor
MDQLPRGRVSRRRVRFREESGVAAFVSARNQGTSLRLFGVPSRVAAVLQTCGVSPNVIGVFADEEAALQDLS